MEEIETLNERTNLVRAPRVRCVVRKTYIVDWTWEGRVDFGGNLDGSGWSGDTQECRHVKTYLSRNPAYLHAAWGWIKNAKTIRGCSKDRCAFGNIEYVNQYGDTSDTRCKYCNHDKAYEIAKRLARWLRWRDDRIEALGGH